MARPDRTRMRRFLKRFVNDSDARPALPSKNTVTHTGSRLDPKRALHPSPAFRRRQPRGVRGVRGDKRVQLCPPDGGSVDRRVRGHVDFDHLRHPVHAVLLRTSTCCSPTPIPPSNTTSNTTGRTTSNTTRNTYWRTGDCYEKDKRTVCPYRTRALADSGLTLSLFVPNRTTTRASAESSRAAGGGCSGRSRFWG